MIKKALGVILLGIIPFSAQGCPKNVKAGEKKTPDVQIAIEAVKDYFLDPGTFHAVHPDSQKVYKDAEGASYHATEVISAKNIKPDDDLAIESINVSEGNSFQMKETEEFFKGLSGEGIESFFEYAGIEWIKGDAVGKSPEDCAGILTVPNPEDPKGPSRRVLTVIMKPIKDPMAGKEDGKKEDKKQEGPKQGGADQKKEEGPKQGGTDQKKEEGPNQGGADQKKEEGPNQGGADQKKEEMKGAGLGGGEMKGAGLGK